MNYKPFDLQKALSGEYEVVTRSGIKPDQMYYFDKAKDLKKLETVIQGYKTGHYDDGKFISDEDSDYDLFLLPKTVDRWINVYGDNYVSKTLYKSYEDAKLNSCDNVLTVQTIKIQVEL